LDGAKKTGVTIIKIDEGVDSGPILSQAEARLTKSANFEILYDYLAEAGAGLLLDTLPYYLTHELKPTNQNEAKASYSKMFTKKDGEVTLQTPAVEVERKIKERGGEYEALRFAKIYSAASLGEFQKNGR